MKNEITGLEPCPFCGNENVAMFACEYDKTLNYIVCNRCHSEFTVTRWVEGKKSNNRDRLIEVWNKRQS